MARRSHNHTVDIAAALDTTVTVTALYYFLVVRRGLRSKGSMVFVASVSLFRVSLAFRNPWIGGLGEIGMIGSVWGGLVSFPFLAWELSVLYYAVAWWAKPDGFADLILMVGLASLLELAPVHLLVAHWSVGAAWILTALSLYGAVWAVSMFRSLRVPLDRISIRKTEPILAALAVPRNSTPTLYLQFSEPLEAERILGLKKRVSAIGISPDDLPAFQAAIG